MPKVNINSAKGLYQDSGSGLIVDGQTSALSIQKSLTATSGIHFYQEEVDFGGTTLTATDDGLLAYLSVTLPANSVVLFSSMTCTELSDLATADFDLGLTATTDTASGVAMTAETNLCTGLGCDATDSIGNTVGLSTAQAVVALTSVAIYNNTTTNAASASASGKILVTIIFAGSAQAS
jgi:hypothetical protein